MSKHFSRLCEKCNNWGTVAFMTPTGYVCIACARKMVIDTHPYPTMLCPYDSSRLKWRIKNGYILMLWCEKRECKFEANIREWDEA